MKILLVNKFLYPKGGAETYVIKLGKYLEEQGNEVQYFGCFDEKNTLKNKENLYVEQYDLSKNNLKSMINAIKLIYSVEAKNKMFKLLKKFNPDLIILNNIEYHLTPSIILAVGKYKKNINKDAKLFYVAHDYQLICPSHGLFDTELNICEKCLSGNYWNCYKTKCLKNSKAKSLIGTVDSFFWRKKNVYKYVDKIICPSFFLKTKLDTQEEFKNKTVAVHNFIDKKSIELVDKENYILNFGKFCKDKGTETLLDVVEELKDIQFVFAGYGPSVERIEKTKNANYVGFKTGKELEDLISKASISIYPSEWYENCPFSVIESQMYRTPVIGSNMGGIPELIKNGETGLIFKSKDKQDLKNKILELWNDKEKIKRFSENCKEVEFETLESYWLKMMNCYEDCKKEGKK